MRRQVQEKGKGKATSEISKWKALVVPTPKTRVQVSVIKEPIVEAKAEAERRHVFFVTDVL